MMRLIKTHFALGLATLLATGCAITDGASSDSPPSAASHAVLEAGGGLEGVEATSGVTDFEAALETSGGSTDEALPGLPVAPLARVTIVRTRMQSGPVANTASSTGTGVSHGSPQPLDPKPTDSATKAAGGK